MLIEATAPASAPGVRRVEFLGLGFDDLSTHALVDNLARRPPDSRFGYLVTPNVDHMVRLSDVGEPDGEGVWAAYRDADHCVCDSRILAALARLRGIVLPVTPGSDLTERLFRDVVRPGDRIAIVGGDAQTLARLGRSYPGCVLLQHIPPMGMRRDPTAMAEAADFVVGARARFVFLAVGSPQQELLAARVRENPAATGFALCIGAAIEFLVGTQQRAPKFAQKLGLEWAHRLASNPRRLWRRYLVDGPRIFRQVARWRR
jgi:N-acetylglucosaminyldiphosphoundecaprenol N-acetyl-beta-D-mannosaminyltransferase